MKKIIASTFLSICFLTVTRSKSCATVEVWRQAKSISSQVIIEYSSNHDYTPQNAHLWYAHTAGWISIARTRLLKEKSIQAIPILISIPSGDFPVNAGVSQISLESECSLKQHIPRTLPGNDNISIGRCYKINYVGVDLHYENILSLVSLLPTLKNDGQVTIIENMTDDKKIDEKNIFDNIIRNYNPIWAPNSQFVVFTNWQDNQIKYLVHDVSTGTKESLEPAVYFKPNMVPFWSNDSQYLFLTAFNKITIYNTNNKKIITVDLPSRIGIINFELLLSYDSISKKLIIVRDVNLFSNYELYEYDLTSLELKKIVSDINRPQWGLKFDSYTYLKNTEATSPNGRWHASIINSEDESKISVEEFLPMLKNEEPKEKEKINTEVKKIIPLNIKLIIFLTISFFSIIFIFIAKKKIFKPKLNESNELKP